MDENENDLSDEEDLCDFDIDIDINIDIDIDMDSEEDIFDIVNEYKYSMGFSQDSMSILNENDFICNSPQKSKKSKQRRRRRPKSTKIKKRKKRILGRSHSDNYY